MSTTIAYWRETRYAEEGPLEVIDCAMNWRPDSFAPMGGQAWLVKGTLDQYHALAAVYHHIANTFDDQQSIERISKIAMDFLEDYCEVDEGWYWESSEMRVLHRGGYDRNDSFWGVVIKP